MISVENQRVDRGWRPIHNHTGTLQSNAIAGADFRRQARDAETRDAV
jgi:hypothetical protein